MLMEGPDCFPPSVEACESTGLEPPRAVYANDGEDGNCAIIGGFVYRGLAMPELDGFFVYGDFCSGEVRGFRFENGEAVGDKLLVDSGLNITSFGEDQNGELYVLTIRGGIYRLKADR